MQLENVCRECRENRESVYGCRKPGEPKLRGVDWLVEIRRSGCCLRRDPTRTWTLTLDWVFFGTPSLLFLFPQPPRPLAHPSSSLDYTSFISLSISLIKKCHTQKVSSESAGRGVEFRVLTNCIPLGIRGSQATLARVLHCSRPDALNATLLLLASLTKSAPTCTVSGYDRLSPTCD